MKFYVVYTGQCCDKVFMHALTSFSSHSYHMFGMYSWYLEIMDENLLWGASVGHHYSMD